jgi:hypothetical protein
VEDMLRLNKNDNMGMRHYAYVMYWYKGERNRAEKLAKNTLIVTMNFIWLIWCQELRK